MFNKILGELVFVNYWDCFVFWVFGVECFEGLFCCFNVNFFGIFKIFMVENGMVIVFYFYFKIFVG